MIHGYDYKFMRSPAYADRWNTWVKVPMIKKQLETHDIVVFMDTDAEFNVPTIPLEWLLNYWQLKESHLVAMAVDPDASWNKDSFGNLLLNTGFVVAQQSERTQEMFKDWAECPEETKYPGCGKWKTELFHEQRAFGQYLRYEYNRTDDILVLPCDEANGSPQAHNSGCSGRFMRHYWIEKKHAPITTLGDAVMQAFAPRLHALFHENEENVIDLRDKTLEGGEVVR